MSGICMLSCEQVAAWRKFWQQKATRDWRAEALTSVNYCNEWVQAQEWDAQGEKQVMEKEFSTGSKHDGSGEGWEMSRFGLFWNVSTMRERISQGNTNPQSLESEQASQRWGKVYFLKSALKNLIIVDVALDIPQGYGLVLVPKF